MNTSLLQEILTRRGGGFRHSRLFVVLRVASSVRVFLSRQVHFDLVWQVVALFTVTTTSCKLLLGPLVGDMGLLVILRLDLFI